MLLAYHDRSDGGLLATVAEMMFASRLGVSLQLDGAEQQLLEQLFNEEAGDETLIDRRSLHEARFERLGGESNTGDDPGERCSAFHADGD